MNKLYYRKALFILLGITLSCGIGVYVKSYSTSSWESKMRQLSPVYDIDLESTSKYSKEQQKIRKLLLSDLPYKEFWDNKDADVLIDLMNSKYSDRILNNKILNDSSPEAIEDAVKIQNVEGSMACISLRLSVDAPVQKEALIRLIDALVDKLSSPFYLDRMTAIASINVSGAIYLEKCYNAVYQLQKDPVPEVAVVARNSINFVDDIRGKK